MTETANRQQAPRLRLPATEQKVMRTFNIRRVDLERMEALAIEKGCSVNALARRAIDLLLEERNATNP